MQCIICLREDVSERACNYCGADCFRKHWMQHRPTPAGTPQKGRYSIGSAVRP